MLREVLVPAGDRSPARTPLRRCCPVLLQNLNFPNISGSQYRVPL